MKAAEKAYRKLEGILTGYGFKTVEGALGGRQVIPAEKTDTYASIRIMEMHDRYENTKSAEDFRAYGHLEVTASICRMGGEMTAEDFTEAAGQMARCGEILKELEDTDLSYTALINGEAAPE